MKPKHIVPTSIILVPYLVIAPILLNLLSALLFPDLHALDAWLLHALMQNPGLSERVISCYIPITLYILFPLSLILNVVWALFLRWDTAELAKWNLRIKLWLIPFYLFAFVFAIGVPLAIPFIVIGEVLLLLVTSCYGFRATVRAKKEGRIADGMFVALFLCHFCFVVDLIAAFLLYRKLKTIPIAQNW